MLQLLHIGILLSETRIPQWVHDFALACAKALPCEISFIQNNGKPSPKPSLPITEKEPAEWAPSQAIFHLKVDDLINNNNPEKHFKYLFYLSGDPIPASLANDISASINDTPLRSAFPSPNEIYKTGNGCFTISLSQTSGGTLNEGRFRCLDYSVTKTIRQLHSHLSTLFIEGIIQLEKNGSSNYNKHLPELTYRPPSAIVVPGIFSKIRHLINILFYRYKWNIGIVDSPIDNFLQPHQLPSVKWKEEVKGLSFIADPFGYLENGKPVLLYERYDEQEQRGLLEMTGETTATLLPETKHHLSYPFFIEVNGEQYCIPEQAGSGKLDAYKISNGKLHYSHTLLKDFDAVDATILHHEEKWWIFATRKQNNGADLRLHLFYADDFYGTWMPHPLNPVKTDICTARPAGNFFRKDGKLYRPAQDSSLGYGSGIHIMEVTRLDTEAFSEHIHLRITPPLNGHQYPDGLHTISTCGNQTLVDGKRKVFTLKPLFTFFRKKGINQQPE